MEKLATLEEYLEKILFSEFQSEEKKKQFR